ncbi:hypothetical protein [Nesterenkonia alba]|uniref:hypothetical protein n=1 Tax=Nesterenkonia alba TaxID=515814 RepID=UPI0003B402E6|nr:hypothetical protein [Nesterenkonia alba]
MSQAGKSPGILVDNEENTDEHAQDEDEDTDERQDDARDDAGEDNTPEDREPEERGSDTTDPDDIDEQAGVASAASLFDGAPVPVGCCGPGLSGCAEHGSGLRLGR